MASSLHPARWQPPPAPPLKGVYAVNQALDVVERFHVPDGVGPEDVVVDGDGRVYCGVEDGRVLRFDPGSTEPAVVSHTYGRPLGIELDAEGRLIVCDARRGLLRVDTQDGTIEPLVTHVDGRRLRFTNNAAVAPGGTIYFSESSTRFGIDEVTRDLLEHRPNGCLHAFDPGTGEVRTLLDELYFANGVALAQDASFVVVAETGAYRLTRHWLTGERAGATDRLVDNLPGFPDNVSANGRGRFWVAIASLRKRPLDLLMPLPAVRRLVDRLPDRFQPDAVRYGLVLGVDESGEVVHALHGPSGAYHYVTGVREHDGWLWLGSLEEPAIARVRVPADRRPNRRSARATTPATRRPAGRPRRRP